MQLSRRGIDLIKKFEGLKLKAYKCPAGIWTIGYGSTGKDVVEGMTVTEEEAERRLMDHVRKFEIAVSLLGVGLTQNQFDALVSFVYNVGAGAFAGSTMHKLLKLGEYTKAANEFSKWTRGGGKVLPGLVKRRAAEMELFLA